MSTLFEKKIQNIFGHFLTSHPETGAVHSCGHHAQSATLLGIAAALTEPHMLDGLSGRIKLCAVPAEELLEIEYRTELKKQGKIKYFGGKSEFMSRGDFEYVDKINSEGGRIVYNEDGTATANLF